MLKFVRTLTSVTLLVQAPTTNTITYLTATLTLYHHNYDVLYLRHCWKLRVWKVVLFMLLIV